MGRAEIQPKGDGQENLSGRLGMGVKVGDCVEFRFDGEEPERVKLVAAGEGKDCEVGDCVAADTPFGKAVDGHIPGETVSFRTPVGVQKIEIIGISKCDDGEDNGSLGVAESQEISIGEIEEL